MKAMKQLFLLSSLLLLVSSCISINNGSTVVSFSGKDFEGAPSKIVSTEHFTSLHNSGSLPVVYRKGDTYEVKVEGDESMFVNAKLEVVKDELMIGLEPGTYKDLWLRVVVTSPDISSVWQSGSGKIDCSSLTGQRELTLWVSGSGSISADTVICQNLTTNVSGSGHLTVGYAACAEESATVSGSGMVKMHEAAVANDMKMLISGSGSAQCNHLDVLSTLEARVSGSGSVKVNGQAEKVKAIVQGSGSIGGDLEYNHIEKEKSGSGNIRL